MNNLATTVVIRLLLGVMISVGAGGCGGSYAPVTTDMVEREIREAAANLIEPTADAAAEKIAEYRRMGFTGLINVSFRGVNSAQRTLTLASVKIQNPVTLEWSVPYRTVVALTETARTGFFMTTGLTDAPDVLFRYLVEVKLPSGARYETEIASGGVALRVFGKPKEDETLIMMLAVFDPHAAHQNKKESSWEINCKQEFFDDFLGKTAMKEKAHTIPRKDDHRLWLRLSRDGIEIFSAESLKEMNERDKPDLVLGSVSTVVMKRIDPPSNPAP